MPKQHSEKEYKVVLLGPSNAGKTTLFNNIIYDEPNLRTSYTIGAILGAYSLNETTTLNFWDTAGQEKFTALTTFYKRGADLLILTVDPLSETFVQDIEYLQKVLASSETNLHVSHTVPHPGLILVATKSDLVTPENSAIAAANIETFYSIFAKPATSKPLHISANDPAAKQLIMTEVIEQLKNLSDKVDVGLVSRVDTRRLISELNNLQTKLSKRFFKPDASRQISIDRLLTTLRRTPTLNDIKEALINEARFIRTPDEFGRHRYGINIGSTHLKFFVHFRTYEESSLYQFLKKELYKIDPMLDLAQASALNNLTVTAAANHI